jgi:hypothetical protein
LASLAASQRSRIFSSFMLIEARIASASSSSRMARSRATVSRCAASRRSAVALSKLRVARLRRWRLQLAHAQAVEQRHFQIVISFASEARCAGKFGVMAAGVVNHAWSTPRLGRRGRDIRCGGQFGQKDCTPIGMATPRRRRQLILTTGLGTVRHIFDPLLEGGRCRSDSVFRDVPDMYLERDDVNDKEPYGLIDPCLPIWSALAKHVVEL